MPGIAPVGGGVGQAVAGFPPGFVAHLAQPVSIQRVGGQAGAAQVIPQQVHQPICPAAVAVTHCHPRPPGGVVAGHGLEAAVPFEVIPHVGGGRRPPHFDLCPVIAAVGRRAVQVIAHVAHAALGEGVGLARQRLHIFARYGAVGNGGSGEVV